MSGFLAAFCEGFAAVGVSWWPLSFLSNVVFLLVVLIQDHALAVAVGDRRG